MFHSGVVFKINPPTALSLAYKTFRWSIIKREDLIGVRFRDLANPALDALKKIDRFKVSEDWILDAEFKPSVVPTITTTNVLGQSYQQPHPGKISFKINGKLYAIYTPTVPEFEKEFASYAGGKYSVMVNSGSSANLILLTAGK